MLKKYYWVLYFVVLFLSIMLTKIDPGLSFIVLLVGLILLFIYGVLKGFDSNLALVVLVLCIYNLPIWFFRHKKHYNIIQNYNIVSYDPYFIKFDDNNRTHVQDFLVPNCPDKIVIIKEIETLNFWLAKNASKRVKYYIGCRNE